VVVGGLVRGVQPGERVEEDLEQDRPRHGLRDRERAGDDARHRVALDVLHHEVITALALPDLEDEPSLQLRRDAPQRLSAAILGSD